MVTIIHQRISQYANFTCMYTYIKRGRGLFKVCSICNQVSWESVGIMRHRISAYCINASQWEGEGGLFTFHVLTIFCWRFFDLLCVLKIVRQRTRALYKHASAPATMVMNCITMHCNEGGKGGRLNSEFTTIYWTADAILKVFIEPVNFQYMHHNEGAFLEGENCRHII